VPPFSVPTIATSATRAAITRVTLRLLLTGGVLAARTTRLFCRTSALSASGSATTSAGAMEAMSRVTTAPDISLTRLNTLSGAG